MRLRASHAKAVGRKAEGQNVLESLPAKPQQVLGLSGRLWPSRAYRDARPPGLPRRKPPRRAGSLPTNACDFLACRFAGMASLTHDPHSTPYSRFGRPREPHCSLPAPARHAPNSILGRAQQTATHSPRAFYHLRIVATDKLTTQPRHIGSGAPLIHRMHISPLPALSSTNGP